MNPIKAIKHVIIASILLMFVINTDKLLSQPLNSNGKIITGVKGGINQINLVGKNKEEFNNLSGYQIGIFLERNIFHDWFGIENISLRSELYYSAYNIELKNNDINILIFDGAELFTDEEIHGYRLERNTGGLLMIDQIFNEEVYTAINYQFLNAPVRFNYLFLPNSKFIRPYLSIAPVFSILISVDHQFTLITDNGKKYTQTDIDKRVNTHFRRFNLALEYGGGINLPMGFFLEAYYSMGLTESLVHYQSSTKKRGIMANIGYRF